MSDKTARKAAPGIGRCLLSMIYDLLLLSAVMAVFFLLPLILLGVFAGWAPGPATTQAIFLLICLVYFVWFWSNGGQTLALKTWKMRIISADGAPLRPAQAVLRHLAAWASLLLLGAGFAWALFDAEHRFFHDRVAGTRIDWA